MNHKNRSGNITMRRGSENRDNSIDKKENDTSIGLVIKFLNAVSCAFAEASLACLSLAPIMCVPILLIGRVHAPSSFLQAKTPHLGYIGVPNPPRGRSSMSSEDDGDGGSHQEQEAVAAEEAYILGAPPREQGISSLMSMRIRMKIYSVR
jgi:hypothetical protein